MRRSSPSGERSPGTDQFILYATPEEVREINAELVALLTRFHDRLEDVERRPPGSRPVEIVALTYPVDPLPRPADVAELLRIADLRRYLAGQVLSLFGDSALLIVLAIWAKQLTTAAPPRAWCCSRSSRRRC